MRRLPRPAANRITTKSYPYFAKVVALLRREFPGLTIIPVGTITSSPIPNAHLNLIGQTTIAQTAEIVRNSLPHVDGESGIVHLAACLGVRSCVIFGPASLSYFAYEHNINIPPGNCGNCWWMTPDWLKRCPRGFKEPRCMSHTAPEMIVAVIRRHLTRLGSASHCTPVSPEAPGVTCRYRDYLQPIGVGSVCVEGQTAPITAKSVLFF